MLDFAFSDDLRFDNEALAVDVHVRITVPSERRECYMQHLTQFGAEYAYANHLSETSLTLPALLTIPVCFTTTEVESLFIKLDTIRRLRY
jgi:hypothetical protein